MEIWIYTETFQPRETSYFAWQNLMPAGLLFLGEKKFSIALALNLYFGRVGISSRFLRDFLRDLKKVISLKVKLREIQIQKNYALKLVSDLCSRGDSLNFTPGPFMVFL